jgi:dTDP-glucose pyrophosphorylase
VIITPVVMAAGEGTRLRPLTDRWPKTLLPIDGRPVIATLLRELASAGFGQVAVVTGHLAEQVESLVGDGTAFGLRVSFVHQPEALGSAEAVVRALDAGVPPPLLVTAADTVFVPGDIGRVTEAWAARRAAGAVGVRRGGRPDQTRVQVEDGRVSELAGNEGEHSAAPIWFLGEELAESLRAVPGPPFEIAHAVQEAIAAGREILALEMGPTRDLTRPTDVVAHNFPYLLRDGR